MKCDNRAPKNANKSENMAIMMDFLMERFLIVYRYKNKNKTVRNLGVVMKKKRKGCDSAIIAKYAGGMMRIAVQISVNKRRYRFSFSCGL